MNKRTRLLSLVVLVSGCATTTPNIEPTLTIVDIPPIGVRHTTEIGSPLVQKARVYEYDAYELLSEYKYVGTGLNTGYRLTARPGVYIRQREDQGWTYFIANSPLVESCTIVGCHDKLGGFRVRSTDGEIQILEPGNIPVELTEPPNWRKTRYADVDEPSFRRELIYNGKGDSNIYLLYREFSRDMARPAFSQELTYDLDEGNIVGFRGVRIEVINTSNVDITYRVLSSFPD